MPRNLKNYTLEEKANLPERKVARYRAKKLPSGEILYFAIRKGKGPRGGKAVLTAIARPKKRLHNAESGYVILSEAYDTIRGGMDQ